MSARIADVSALLRSDVARLHTYQPVPTPEVVAARLGISPDEIVKLDANENPFGPPPAVVEALRGGNYQVERYPDPDATALREACSEYTGVPVERIVAGNGSDELIDLLCRIFIEPGDRVLTCEPTFGVYRFAASQWGAQVVDVPRTAGFDVDTEALLAALDDKTRLVFLCAPNNPSGNPLAVADLRAVLEATSAPVVLDEAYAEFAGVSYLTLMGEYPNLCVLRTLSKIAALAGLRVGYGAFPLPVAEALWKVKPPYNVNVAGQVAGVAALSEATALLEQAVILRDERARVATALVEYSGLQVFDSATNFTLVRFLESGGAAAAYEALLAKGILVRRYVSGRLADCLRISAGTPAQNNRLLEELNALWR